MPEIAAPICPCCGAVCAGEAKALVYPILSDLDVIAALRADLKAVAAALENILPWTRGVMDAEEQGVSNYAVIILEAEKALDRRGVVAALEGAKNANR